MKIAWNIFSCVLFCTASLIAPLVMAETEREMIGYSRDINYDGVAGAPMKSLRYFQIRSWTMVDDRHVLLWSKIKEPYLIALRQPCLNADTAQTLSFTSFGRTITAKMDSVAIGSCKSRIESIRPIDYIAMKEAKDYLEQQRREKRQAKN